MTTAVTKPKVLIVGAGLGGVTLAILLERAGVPYEIFERAHEVRPLGSALSLGSNILPLFEQLGLYDDYMKNAKCSLVANMMNENRELDHQVDLSMLKELGGYYGSIVSRPFLYNLLISQIPTFKIHMNKKVISIDQKDDDDTAQGVTIHCGDGTSYKGDILVGADGAHSGIRQALYDDLKRQDKLPLEDDGELPFSSICLVGQTEVLDKDEFPELEDPHCNPQSVLGDKKPYTWLIFTTKSNNICWTVTHHLNKTTSKSAEAIQNIEWGPEGAESMCRDVRDFPITGGKNKDLTLGDLIDRTPKELISKVMLEEKVFDTWYSGRTVLMGDAVHKLNPAGAQGAVNAMQDAITLANWINLLPGSPSTQEISTIFKEYRDERRPLALEAFSASQMMAKNVEQNWTGAMVRFVSKYMPIWFQRIAVAKMVANRPQVSFLPLVKDLGSVTPTYQPSLEKTRRILEERAAAAAAVV